MVNKKAICILSGGLDSTTLLYEMRERFKDVQAITFDYGQRHRKEIQSAVETCDKLKVKWKLINVSDTFKAIGGSALTDDKIKVPHGHYEEESMKATVVPNRNSILINIALAHAIISKAEFVGYGAHSGDHEIYPDCRPIFLFRINQLAQVIDYKPISIYAPFMAIDKAAIIKLGIQLEVDYSLTWTCYEGKEYACGKCGSCQERLEAFKKNGLKDPIKYV